MTEISLDDAHNLILNEDVPPGLVVNGHLDFTNHTQLKTLPEGLKVKRLTLDGCSSLQELPRGLHCFELSAQGTPLKTLPSDIRIENKFDLSNCDMLEELPSCLSVGILVLNGCISLRHLPEKLDTFFLDMVGCTSITAFPTSGLDTMGRLNVRGCTRLRNLPSQLRLLAQLDVGGCDALRQWPENLCVTSWIDVADISLETFPEALRDVSLRWRGVFVPKRVVFQPETITAREVLSEQNLELRRVMMERMGYDRFMEQAEPKILDTDQDPGGMRKLLHIDVQGDEPLVCLAVQCPSTGRRYMMRVPPDMQTCHQAAAWIAGYDNPDAYHPLIET